MGALAENSVVISARDEASCFVPIGKQMELDLQTVDAILAGESPHLKMYAQSDLPALELGDFRNCSDRVLDHLVSNIGPLDLFWFGIEDLPRAHAQKLSQLSTYNLYLPQLNCLDEEAAKVLGAAEWPLGHAPILDFELRSPISEKTALGLVAGYRCDVLTLDLPSISLGVARALMAQAGELCLRVESQSLTAELARVLSKHRGYHLTAYLGLEQLDETFCGMAIRNGLGSNPGKRLGISRKRGRVILCDVDMWSFTDEDDWPPD